MIPETQYEINDTLPNEVNSVASTEVKTSLTLPQK